MSKEKLALIQISILLIGFFGWYILYDEGIQESGQSYSITVTDSNGVVHQFEESPSRVAISNTYIASAMRMLNVSSSVVVGVSGDFDDSVLWPEYNETKIVQNSAHSEIDFEALYDARPDVYIVFATNGMVDTSAIRNKLDQVGISVIALDFYKYDYLRTEFQVIADLFNKQEEMDDLLADFDSIELLVEGRISSLEPNNRPTVVMEHHASLTRDPVVLTGTSQWTDMIEKAGGMNFFAELPGHTTHVDMEAILDANPDVILFDGITFDIGFNRFDTDGISCDEHIEFVSERPGFDGVQAVIDDRMLIFSGEFAGPMMIHGLPTLAKHLHPEKFLDIDADSYLDEYFSEYHGVERIGKFVCQSGNGD
jgi:iron complex transport system substrate-binding protein